MTYKDHEKEKKDLYEESTSVRERILCPSYLVLDYHNRFLICWHGHTSFTWGPQAIMMINIIIIINRIEIWGSDRLSAAQ